jgi:hypothetical protein
MRIASSLMETPAASVCPGCGSTAPAVEGPTHDYIGASPECWAGFAALFNAGTPPTEGARWWLLVGDAYAVQHPGVPERRSIQSVGIHLLVLHGVLLRGLPVDQAMEIRRRLLRSPQSRQRVVETLSWLDPPEHWPVRVDDVIGAADPRARGRVADEYVEGVWSEWHGRHGATLDRWDYALLGGGRSFRPLRRNPALPPRLLGRFPRQSTPDVVCAETSPRRVLGSGRGQAEPPAQGVASLGQEPP